MHRGRVLPVEEGSGARKGIPKTYVRPYKANIGGRIILRAKSPAAICLAPAVSETMASDSSN